MDKFYLYITNEKVVLDYIGGKKKEFIWFDFETNNISKVSKKLEKPLSEFRDYGNGTYKIRILTSNSKKMHKLSSRGEKPKFVKNKTNVSFYQKNEEQLQKCIANNNTILKEINHSAEKPIEIMRVEYSPYSVVNETDVEKFESNNNKEELNDVTDDDKAIEEFINNYEITISINEEARIILSEEQLNELSVKSSMRKNELLDLDSAMFNKLCIKHEMSSNE